MVENNSFTKKGDDHVIHRLLFLCQSNAYLLKRLTKSIYHLGTDDGSIVVKGYLDRYSRDQQIWLTKRLHQSKFSQTYQIRPLSDNSIDGKWYGIINWIEHHSVPFSFSKEYDRIMGLKLLKKYHLHTETFLEEGKTYFHSLQPYEKWSNRMLQFKRNLPYIKCVVPKTLIEPYLYWGELALHHLKRLDPHKKSSRVLLHGDVAHHNFVRRFDQKVYLIDFDLVSIGHPIHDYLQYANRILPYLDWDLKKLKSLPILSDFMTDPYFIYALMFPTDVFREWNRSIQNQLLTNERTYKMLHNLTIQQFELRQAYHSSLLNMIQ